MKAGMREKLETKVEMRKEEMEEAEEETSIKYRGWKAMPYVIGNETFEKLGTIGTSSNLLVYLTSIFHMQSVTATTLLNINNGTLNLAPILGAFLSDTYFGRYLTIGFASISSLLGMFILTLTAAISNLHPAQCINPQQCAGPTTAQLAVLLSSFVFLVIGAGGIRPCNLAFGADQFDPNTDSGKKGINSFFNWYYFTFTFAVMISSTIIIYVQSDVSWSIGLAIPTMLMLLSCAFFFWGSGIYVKVKPQGSPLTSMAMVVTAAYKKRGLANIDNIDPKASLYNPSLKKSCINSKLPCTDQFRFLDKAARITSPEEIKSNGSPSNPWRLCTLQQVEEVKCILRILPIWSSCILYAVAIVQNSSYVVFSALQSNRHIGNSKFEIPAASISIFSMIALTIWIPIYDRIIVPRLRKVTKKEGGITLLQRMGIGMILAIVAMIVAGLVEKRRRASNSTMSSFWLIPQLCILGLSEAFNIIAQVEFYYKQFPENMRSFAGSLTFLSSALANYVSGFIITIVHEATGGNGGKRNWLDTDLDKGRLDYFYYLIAFIGMVNFMYFLVCAKWYRYKGFASESEIALEGNKSLV